MPFYDLECKLCKRVKIDVLARIGHLPPCEECGGETKHVWTGQRSHVNGDEIPGGVILENMGPTPRRFDSYSAIEAACKERHVDKQGREYYLTPMVRHVGVPGTDKSPHTTDWSKGSIDPYTLEAARLLVERVTTQGPATSEPLNESSEDYNDPNFRDPSVEHFEYAGSGEEARRVIDILKNF